MSVELPHMRALTTDQWRALNNASIEGDRLTYWSILSDAGDPYARLAVQVVLDASLSGRAANRHFVDVATKIRGEAASARGEIAPPITPALVNQVGVDLMREDFARRIETVGAQDLNSILSDVTGVDYRAIAPLLSASNITIAHQVVFRKVGAGLEAWTLAPIMTAFESNHELQNQLFYRVASLASKNEWQAGGIINRLTEGLRERAEAGSDTMLLDKPPGGAPARMLMAHRQRLG